ncbi:MAG: winged helix-turn-helix transcriptional regulator [Nitrospirae bacterium]|nr:winged helix-turn-helix transcriptional regulator [Nitrospirota bacterium]
MTSADFTRESDMLKALANPTRLNILEILKENEQCVKAMEELLEVGQSALSQHLALLRHLGIVDCRREGMNVCYSIRNRDILPVLEIIKEVFY